MVGEERGERVARSGERGGDQEDRDEARMTRARGEDDGASRVLDRVWVKRLVLRDPVLQLRGDLRLFVDLASNLEQGAGLPTDRV